MNELILIVEDEEDVAQLLRYNLQKAGYRTVVAPDGVQALRIVRLGEPDLVLLDLMLPEMNGWEVCRVMRGSEQAETTPVIMLTALSDEDARLRGLKCGADDYITKPFSLPTLLLKVRRLLDQRQALAALRSRSESMESSLHFLVHEMKNSLAVISGFTDLATEKPDGGMYLQRIATATDTLDHLLADASLLTKLESGVEALLLEAVDITAAVEELVASFQTAAAARNVTLMLMNRSSGKVQANSTGLWHVLSNLLTNAIKFNREQGHVWFRFDDVGGRIELSIKDEGPGIPRELFPKIFGKFYRGPGSESVRGSGIGLYVVKLMLENMRGTITVASTVGTGTTFTIAFPKLPSDAGTTATRGDA